MDSQTSEAQRSTPPALLSGQKCRAAPLPQGHQGAQREHSDRGSIFIRRGLQQLLGANPGVSKEVRISTLPLGFRGNLQGYEEQCST